MHISSLLSVAATVWWGLTLIVHTVALIAVFIQPRIRQRAASRQDKAPVSVVIPIKNMDPDLKTAFVSVFSQSYPRFEVLITAAEEASLAIDVGQRIASQFPHIESRFLLGNKHAMLNPKISNVAPAIIAAKHGLILIKDASVRLAQDQLEDLVRNLTTDTGMVCAVPIGTRPETFCAEIECAMMNAHQAPLLMAGSILHLDIGFGKVMLFDRRNFDRVDGIAAMAPKVGDDHALAKALSRIGLPTVLSGRVIEQTLGHRTLREVWDRQLRWMVIRRNEEALAFFAEPFFCAGFATLAAAAAAPTLGTAWWVAATATLAFWLTSETVVVAMRRWGWSRRFLLAGVCRELLIIGLWMSAWLTRKVQWAGISLDVDKLRIDAT
jgi:ceramide glucosyltransferase